MRKRTSTLACVVGIVMAFAIILLPQTATAYTAGAGIDGSPHDLRAEVSSLGGQICKICHVPHNGQEASNPEKLIWNHAFGAGPYTMYNSNTLDGAIDTAPSGISKLCVGCHDGTVAIDSYGGVTGSVTMDSINANANLGQDLSTSHPVSIVFDPTADSGLNPKTAAFGSVTIQDVLGTGDKVQCSTCHDVHNQTAEAVETPLLRVSLTASSLCLQCHNK